MSTIIAMMRSWRRPLQRHEHEQPGDSEVLPGLASAARDAPRALVVQQRELLCEKLPADPELNLGGEFVSSAVVVDQAASQSFRQ